MITIARDTSAFFDFSLTLPVVASLSFSNMVYDYRLPSPWISSWLAIVVWFSREFTLRRESLKVLASGMESSGKHESKTRQPQICMHITNWADSPMYSLKMATVRHTLPSFGTLVICRCVSDIGICCVMVGLGLPSRRARHPELLQGSWPRRYLLDLQGETLMLQMQSGNMIQY